MATETPTFSLDPKETAVVFIEFQNEFATENGALHDAVKECMEATKTLSNAKELLDASRAAGCTVIHMPITFDEVGFFRVLLVFSSQQYSFNHNRSL